jgi:hypothetical protein
MTKGKKQGRSTVLAMLFLAANVAMLIACSHAGTSAIILDDNLTLVEIIPGPYSIAATGMSGEPNFAVLSAQGLVQVLRQDGGSLEQRWMIPSREKFDSFSVDGKFTVTTRGDEVIWRSTTDGEIAGRIGLAQPGSVSIGLGVGVALSNGQLWVFRPSISELAKPTVRTEGTVVTISADEKVVSIGKPEAIPFGHYDIYNIAGNQLASFSEVRAATWIDDVTFAILGSKEYCEWSQSEGPTCRWEHELEFDHMSADVRPESVLLWSRFSTVLIRYSRNDGQELEGTLVPRHLNISDVAHMGSRIFLSTDRSVTWRGPPR